MHLPSPIWLHRILLHAFSPREPFPSHFPAFLSNILSCVHTISIVGLQLQPAYAHLTRSQPHTQRAHSQHDGKVRATAARYFDVPDPVVHQPPGVQGRVALPNLLQSLIPQNERACPIELDTGAGHICPPRRRQAAEGTHANLPRCLPFLLAPRGNELRCLPSIHPPLEPRYLAARGNGP